MSKPKYYIGIDPGVNTGFALWSRERKAFIAVEAMPIHLAMEMVKVRNDGSYFVRIEDARKRKWFGRSGREQLQGAGSIKRDCSIWEDFLKDNNIPFEMVAPKNNKTKMPDLAFKRITGWTQRTNEHARDAAMLVFGL